MADVLLSDLDESQRAAVVARDLPLAIVAPAGSGKTRVLTRRIAFQAREGNLDARRVLAVTFTRKAAAELGTRLSRLGVEGGVTASTMHAFALGQLRRRASDNGKGFPALLERKARLLAPLVGGARGARRTLDVSDIASQIEWAKARWITPDRFATEATAAQRNLPRPADEVADLYRRYEEAKRRQSLLDFDDLLWWCGDALETDEAFMASMRIRFRHLFVDEFQDVSPAQLRIVRGVLGDTRDLCVVGDDAQAIYGFAGADVTALSQFARHFPGATVVRLATNYRSTPEIIAMADAALIDEAGVDRPMPRAANESGSLPQVRVFDDETAEARGVAAAIREVHSRGVPYRAIAVLYRINAQSLAFETAFASTGIPFRMRDSVGFFSRPEVTLAIDLMREREKQVPGRPFADHLSDLEGDAADEANDERRGYLDALARLASEYAEVEGDPDDPGLASSPSRHPGLASSPSRHPGLATSGSLNGFLSWARLVTRGESIGEQVDDVVDLTTFHRAKGLEWDVVFVVGVEQGLVPISHAKSALDRAEEARLLHVALSRAIQELRISWSHSRELSGRVAKRQPSPWLGTLEETLAPLRRAKNGGSPIDPREQLRAARAKLAAGDRPLGAPPANLDPDLLETLKKWRLQTARAHEMLADQILHNSALEAIAVARPTTLHALLGIPGVGPSKAERYGPDIIEIVKQHESTVAGNPTP